MPADVPKPIPRATYRLQLNKAFGFAAAAAVVPYLAELGVSHVYTSPYLRARPGSTHGYDIVSHGELNPELGSEADFEHFVATLQAHGLGQIADFVPNHMGVGGADNPWWLDVLEWGPDSEFAGWFDIDWESDRRHLRGKLLLPILGGQYGVELMSGALRLAFDPDDGSIAVWAYDSHKLPVSPHHYDRVLGTRHTALERLGDAFANLSVWHPNIGDRARVLRSELAACVRADEAIAGAIGEAVARFEGTPGVLESWSRLDALMRDQHWRVASYRVAGDDINYRRFFDVNDLAGIRMELPEVFDRTHAFIFGLLEKGQLDGLRIDHVDGLLDPKGYCIRLREKAPRPFYFVVEKILASHESLREDWDVDGTTGYEFANLVTGLLIDPVGQETLSRFYAEFTGCTDTFPEVVRAAKLRIMENELASELRVLAREAAHVARSNPLTADFTNNLIERALKEIIAAFPVYRTYVDEDAAPSEADRRDIDWAVAQARRHDAALDPTVFDFLHELLTCDLIAQPGSGFSRMQVVRVAMRAQQYSGPVMAKGLEDTAFYRFNRMLALNEVGGHPDQFGVTLAAFHHANRQRARRWPNTLLSTSTHDTKRGEDTRARLAVISEIPDEWVRHVQLWSRMLRGSEEAPGAGPRDRNDEYSFYQLLLGAWPAEFGCGHFEEVTMGVFRSRIEGAMVKSMREAKLHTSWGRPDAAYESAMLDLVRRALDTDRPNAFLSSFVEFHARVAQWGVSNSLVQTVLKLTVPGVPDIYQGAESWNLSLVDPDNRRPVDYSGRAGQLAVACAADPGALLEHWHDGAIKLRIIADLLALRSRCPDLFGQGSYEPVAAVGPAADRLCAYRRKQGEMEIIVVAAFYPSRGGTGLDATTLEPAASDRDWTELFSARTLRALADLGASEILGSLPVAVLLAA